MIWRRRCDRLEQEWAMPRPWFAWRPVSVWMPEVTRTDGFSADRVEGHWVHIWWQTVLRRRGSDEWKYALPEEDLRQYQMRSEAVMLAPKYAKEIILMSKTGG